MPGKRATARNRILSACVAAGLTVVLTAAAPVTRDARSPNWHVLKTFTLHNTFLVDIVGLRGGVAWAGGESPARAPVLHHRVSRKWHTVILPATPGTFVANLSATSATNVWAALAGEPLVAHLTSNGWVTTPFAQGTDSLTTSDIVTFGPKNTWVFAYDLTTMTPFAEHFNGSAWTQSPLPAFVDCDCSAHAVSASSADNIWAWVKGAKINGFATMRWNGQKWQVIKLPAHLVPAGQQLGADQMLAVSRTNVWATADNTMSTGSIILLHWNGHAWAKIGGKLPKGQLAGPIAPDGSGGLWLIGRTPTSSQFILHYVDGHWTRFAMPTDGADTVQLNALRLVPGTKTVLGAGNLNLSIAGDNGAVVLEFG